MDVQVHHCRHDSVIGILADRSNDKRDRAWNAAWHASPCGMALP